MPVTLRNTKRTAFYGTFYPNIVGRRTSDKLYDVRRVRSARGKIVSEKQPHSFMVPALDKATVHAAALQLPQVKAALKSGWLVQDKAEPAKLSKKRSPKASAKRGE